ncbi:uncharacterized protein LOC124659837 isoform X1 [Lolium rigidum]|uniref:uncharacterized protein LOC124659837 isoform X1 n=2 Tax=Lolium rigidum TaxID=89674 RepID=UPI001F5C3740|nr:uncharacterized protein LOC124659837 isoform X1 [Lolium rigidum]XP_047053613.1 uncharacterized protein LOC124659837 isoform X1 [Lolium rigidum]
MDQVDLPSPGGCSPHLILPIMKLIVENDEQKGYVREIGFESFLSMGELEMNKALNLWLVDKFNCDSEALEFEGGISIPVRPLVKSVLGIPSGPIQVVEGLDVDDALKDQYTVNTRAKAAKDVANEMSSITDKEPFCIAFMMAILGIYLAPNTSQTVNRAFLGAVKQVDKLKEMDWFNFVATYLFKGIKEFKESNTACVTIKGCVHILSVIFIDFVKDAAFEVPVGFPRLGVVTKKHIKWVVSHPFTSLMVRHPEESVYAAVLDSIAKDNIVKDGKCVDSETNSDALTDMPATTDTNQNNNKHRVSGELGTVMPAKPAPCDNPSERKKGHNVMDTGNRPIRSAKSRTAEIIIYKCSPQLLPPIMKLITENVEQKGYVEEIGFGSFLSMAEFKMNRALTLWLVDKFNCDTEALEFEGGISIPVRPLVKSVLGIPSGPIQVVEGLYIDNALMDEYTCNGKVKNAWEVANGMCSIIDKEPFCIAFMMGILGIYLAPSTSVGVNRKLLGAVRQVDKLKEMDWCNFVATYLFKGIKKFKKSKATFVSIKGCVHILSVIFIDFVKHDAFEVPVGFPRLGVVTTEHIKWVVSHPFTSLMVRRPEESIYAAVLDNWPKDNIVEDGKCVTNTDALSDTFGTSNSDQNKNRHPVSVELGTLPISAAVLGPPVTSHNTTSGAIVEYVEVGTSPRSAAPGNFAEQIIFPTSGEQLQSPRPSSEPCSAQMHVSPDNPKGVNRGSTSPMEDAGDWSAKKASVDWPSSGQAKRARGVAAVDLSVLNCTVCSCPLKRPVFQCIGRHLACGRCVTELPGEQCQMCEHGSGFSPCPIMDDIISSAMVDCSHDGCKSSVPYHELDDHESACSHAPCYCTEAGCGFIGPPQVLLDHLAALHSMPVHTVNYGKVHRLLVSKPRFLLHGEGDDSVFLLVVGALGAAMVVSVVCIRAGASPSYAVKLWVNGPALPSRAAGRIKWKMEAVTSSTRTGKVVVEELPSFLTVPPAYLGWLEASKAVTLDIRIDRM